MRTHGWPAGAVVGLAAAVVACGGTTPSAVHATIVIGEAQAGQSIPAKVGDTVRVKLEESFPVPGSSLVWDVSTSAPSLLKPGQVTRDPAVRPVKGAVAYTADFNATAAGLGTLIARGSRTCEAMPTCPGQDFTVTVNISP